jgi:hypothetical protein
MHELQLGRKACQMRVKCPTDGLFNKFMHVLWAAEGSASDWVGTLKEFVHKLLEERCGGGNVGSFNSSWTVCRRNYMAEEGLAWNQEPIESFCRRNHMAQVGKENESHAYSVLLKKFNREKRPKYHQITEPLSDWTFSLPVMYCIRLTCARHSPVLPFSSPLTPLCSPWKLSLVDQITWVQVLEAGIRNI